MLNSFYSKSKTELKLVLPMLVTVATSFTVFVLQQLSSLSILLMLLTIAGSIFTKNPRKILTWITSSAPLIIIYILLTSVVQLLLGFLDLNLIAINILRIMILVVASAILLNSISISQLIKYLNRVSHKLAIVTALSIKMFKCYALTWRNVVDIYTVNLLNWYEEPLRKLSTLKILVNAFLSTTIYSTLQSIDAMVTRYKLFTEGSSSSVISKTE